MSIWYAFAIAVPIAVFLTLSTGSGFEYPDGWADRVRLMARSLARPPWRRGGAR